MVGIARARGCGTCRKRKILCGLEKPTCAQCIKSNRECTGYRQYPVFVDYHGPISNQPNSASSEKKPNGRAKNASTKWQQRSNATVKDPKAGKVRFGGVLVPKLPHPRLCNQISWQPSYRQQILHVYLYQIVPKVELGALRERMWISNVPSLPYLTTALEVSIMAMCVAKIGDFNNDERFKLEGLQLYHRALRELQAAICDPELLFDDQTLGACAALTHYEMIQCPADSLEAYKSHILGCEKLVLLRGPERHTDGLAHKVFSHFRVQDILYNISARRPTYLSEPVWQEIPWRNKTKPAYDRVWDLLSFAPKLLRQGHLLEQMEPQLLIGSAMDLISECWRLDEELSLLFDQVMNSEDGILYWTELANSHAWTVEGIVFPLAFNFQSLDDANTLLMIWSTQAILWHGMTQLYGLMQQVQSMLSDTNSTEVINLRPLAHQVDYVTPSLNIFQAVEYCLRDEFLDLGPKSVAAPLRIAIDTLKTDPRYDCEISWGRAVLRRVQKRSLRILDFWIETVESELMSERVSVV